MRHMSQWDNPDRSRDDPRTKGSENVSILHGYPAAERWPSSVGAGFNVPQAEMFEDLLDDIRILNET